MLIHYKVIVRRDGEIITETLKWGSSIREQAIEALTREAKKMYGDNCTVEIH